MACIQTFRFFTQKSKDGPWLKTTVCRAYLYLGKLFIGMLLDCYTLVTVYVSDQVSTCLMGSKAVGHDRLGFERPCSVLLFGIKLPQSNGSSAETSCLVRFNYFSAVLYTYHFRRSLLVSDKGKNVRGELYSNRICPDY